MILLHNILIYCKQLYNDELSDGILSQFDFTSPDIDKKADEFLHNALNTIILSLPRKKRHFQEKIKYVFKHKKSPKPALLKGLGDGADNRT